MPLLKQPIGSSKTTDFMEAISIYPKLITWSKNKRGTCPLAIGISYAGKLVGFDYLHQLIRPEDWDVDEHRVKKTEPGHALLNALIENRLMLHKNFFLKRQVFNFPISHELIKKYLDVGGAIEDFYTYAEWVLENKKLKNGLPYSDESKRRYSDEILRMRQFKPELQFKQITVEFLNNYRSWLQTTFKSQKGKLLDKNSVWKALGFIRMVYNEAIKNELILSESNPFKTFTVGDYQQDESKIKYLELFEVELIEKTLVEKRGVMEDMTYRVGWRFLTMCVTGMRISDAMTLSQEIINDAGDIDFTPYKTRSYGNRAQVPIVSERQRRYLQQTIQLPLPATDHKSFRTTFNIHLKLLAAHAGISIKFTSHSGRHTMGSFLVDGDVGEKAVMKMLGVKSPKVLKVYQHLKQDKLKSEAAKLGNVF